MAVQYLEINGKKHPVKLGYTAFKKLQGLHGISIDDIHSGHWDYYEQALFYALETGAKLEGEEFTFKMEDMEVLLEECLWEFVGVIPLFFPGTEELEKNLAAIGKKKPPTGQTRKPKA